MGIYNPNLPIILGQEWVPIRDEDLLFDESVNAYEQGTGFTLTTARQVSTGRFYTNHPPKGVYYNQAYTMTVYAKDMEDSAGPVRSVVIPVNNGATTGAGVFILSPDTTVAQALSNPGTAPDRGIRIQSGGGVQNDVNIWFAVNSYSQILAGKRILGVNYLYQFRRVINTSYSIAAGVADEIGFSMRRPIGGFTATWNFPPIAEGPATPPDDTRMFVRRRVGDVAMWYGNDPFNNSNMIPWTYEELQKLEASASNRVDTHINADGFAGDGPDVVINYMGLEVFYCNENRTLFGTTIFNNSMVGSASPRIGFGLNNVALHPVTNTALSNTVLSSGDYVMTLAQGSLGDNTEVLANFGPQAEVNAIRELYPMPAQPGYRMEIPFPLDESVINRQIEVIESAVIPQLSLHTSGAGDALTEPHPYGRQVAAEVWGTIYAQQELNDANVAASHEYPWVRFYARRFGDTTIPLTVTGQAGLATSTASITPDEFDALSETLDGWKEVSLEFATPPIMGVGTAPSFRFTATGELAGNRWEVLGASAPALSGIPGNMYNLAPAAQQLYQGTYDAPTGATQELEWMPQGVGSPFVSGAGIQDDSSDLFLIFAQEPPAVSGFGVITMCQPLTGIGQECEVDPCCVPSAILFNQLSWDRFTDLDAPLGFSYEIQRMDSVDDWQTIMLESSGAGSGLLLSGEVGSFASTPDAAALDIVGDIDLRADVSLDQWMNGGQVLVSKWGASTAFSYRLGMLGGRIQLVWSNNGTSILAEVSTVTVTVPDGGRLAVRATLDVVSGANRVVTFYTAPSLDGPWTQLGSAITTAGNTSIFSGSANVVLGNNSTGSLSHEPAIGIMHGIQILNGIGGTAVANPDFAAQPVGTTSFVDSAGLTWTLQGDATITNIPDVFNDFEARVGLESSYRIRVVDDYGFWGPWSDTVTATILEPGVTIGCRNGGHVLIFTSNERQSGAINLAYSSVWMDQQVTEDFSFPEAGFVQLQAMYDRDYFTAFRPLERGGEQFTRTVLVQAAAISPPTLGDFRSLRDMAWESVNYICVRDEDGNRWFATVGVPSGRVMNSRKLYLAPVQVIEVTATPTPVDPSDASVTGVVEGEFCDSFECEEVVAEDSFDRVEVGGWGQADLGGEWEEV
jgi:hypothetical protein